MNTSRFLMAGAIGGLLLAVLDGLLSANPLGQRMLAYLKPIARERFSMIGGLAIDLAWGFAMAGIYLLLRPSLPGALPIWRGLSFAALAWFFRCSCGLPRTRSCSRLHPLRSSIRWLVGLWRWRSLGWSTAWPWRNRLVLPE